MTGTSTTGRSTPDVASDSNPNTGLAVYDSVSTSGQSGWFEVGGTSAGAPIWAGLVAAADQARAANGLSSLSSTQTLSLLYSASSTDFHDITSGSNLAGSAKTGYDLVTGLGSPVANKLIAAAATYGSTTSSAIAATSTTSKAAAVATTTTTTTKTTTTTITAHDTVAASSTTTTAAVTPQASLVLAPAATTTSVISSNNSPMTASSSATVVEASASSSLPNQAVVANTFQQTFAAVETGVSSNAFQVVPSLTPLPAVEAAVPVESTTSGVSRATWDLACSMFVADQHPNFAGGVISMTAPAVDLLEDVSIPPALPAIVVGTVAAVWAVKAYRSRGTDERRVRALHAWERPVFF